MKCLAAHAPAFPEHIRKEFKKSVTSDKALKRVEEYFFNVPGFKSLAGSTQAIDLIGGGVKTNALPEQAWAVVNHRIATERFVRHLVRVLHNADYNISSVAAVKERDTALLQSLASQFNLSYTAFGVSQSDENAPAYGTLTLSEAFLHGLEPAPNTPIDEHPYQLLSGTIRATYNKHRGRALQGENEIVVAPGIMSGNTGKRYLYIWDEMSGC